MPLQGIGQFVVRQYVVRLDPQGLTIMLDGFYDLPLPLQGNAQFEACLREIRLDPQGPMIMLDGCYDRGELERRELQEWDAIEVPSSVDLIALDAALDKLAQKHPTMARLVQLRFFTGLTVEESGKMLGISRATADRRWAYARAWLYKEIGPED